MDIEVRRSEYSEVREMRDLYRHEAHCQVIGDSLISRGLSDPYLFLVDGRIAGYGGVRAKIDPGHAQEFYVLPRLRCLARDLFREFLQVSGATHIEAQTNIPLSLSMLYDSAVNIRQEAILFEHATFTSLECHDALFRARSPGDRNIAKQEPDGDWVLETDGGIVATGGFLCHYNPPYGDVFMEVVEPARRHGYGSYLVQEVNKVCFEAGKRPAARCGPTNLASRRTLERAGFLPCGRLLVGEVMRPT